ncbi:hypothetical protein F2P81_019303 [Scophthalmus maximus]|uniref:Uncharacterized protein n=1 Tax=Scophthalmus maximus TaxID=52904 RepID=A0A6A4RZA8_SCOMX|nr:hypothetical protein F2P81_019303 [Scophthalmus maximus]
MFTQDLVGYRLGGGECGTCEAGNLTDFGMKGRECSVDRKGGDGIVAVTRTAGEDQVRCGDPRPWLGGRISSGPCSGYRRIDKHRLRKHEADFDTTERHDVPTCSRPH